MSSIRVISIPADQPPKVIRIEKDGESSLKPLQELVGGWIECVALEEGTDLWLNEEGKLIGLPLNPVATKLTRGIVASHDMIVGNCVLAGMDEEGETIDVPEHWISMLGLTESAHG